MISISNNSYTFICLENQKNIHWYKISAQDGPRNVIIDI